MKKLLPVFICLLFGSCFNEGDCLISATNFMHLQFKKRSNHKLDTAVKLNYVYFAGYDSVLSGGNVTEILLPVDIDQNNLSTTYYFHLTKKDSATQQIDTLQIDTLQISYARQTKVISKDCGAYTFYQNLKVTKASKDLEIKAFSTSLIKDPTSTGIASYAINYQIYY